ncbi:MAG: hypothetical protein WC755_07715 [Candidatus Woesearchaeota archaeon]|jgi:hypothetical protein
MSITDSKANLNNILAAETHFSETELALQQSNAAYTEVVDTE